MIIGLSIVSIFTASCSIESVPSTPTLPRDTMTTTTTEYWFKDPSAPIVGGTGLPDSPFSEEEIDCEHAEDLCDSGEWACDDIADYCDIGPDDGSELPEDWDWDD